GGGHMNRLFGIALFLSFIAVPAAAQSEGETTASVAPQSGTPSTEAKKDTAPPHAHTGWATLVKDSARDFVAFPKRKSTWTLLGIGGAPALATPPSDSYVSTHIGGNNTANNVFVLGKWLGSSGVEIGTGVGLWAIGRYVVAPAADESQTNKYSELG